MTLFSSSDPIHSLKTSDDRFCQNARPVIKSTGCWHPIFWTGIATLSTLTLLGLETAISRGANAQTAIDSNFPVSVIQADVPIEENLRNETAGVVESDALETLHEATNHSATRFIANKDNIAIDPAGTSPDLDSIRDDTESDEAGEQAIDEFRQPNFYLTEQNQFNSESSESLDFNQQVTAAGTENANRSDAALVSQSNPEAQSGDSSVSPATLDGEEIAQGGSALLGAPFVQLQGAVVVQGDEFSARARTTASYAITPNLLVGGTLDLVTGDAFTDSPETGLNLNELYVAVSPSEIPTLRFVVGLLDYTSYFDRNSFAKDGVTQFFNPIFQTNPALAAAGLSSRPGVLVNWSVTDNLELRAAGFSSRRDLGDFAIDGFAAEAAVRIQNLILRGTYLTAEDAGDDSGFREIFQFDRGDGDFGLRSGDREQAYGINVEYFVPSIRLGLFARYGWYDNLDLGRGGETYSFGFNLLDLFLQDDRLGLAYGRDLSDEGLRKQRDDDLPDVVELFYDARLLPYLRAGFTAQARNSFSETILGFRVRADFALDDLGGIFR